MESRFSFAISSTGRRPDKTTEPQMTVTTTKGNFKFNGAATRLIKLQHGDHAALISNEDDILRAIANGDVSEDTQPTWAVIKGYPVLDASGKVKQSVKRLTDAETQELIEAGETDDEGNVLPQYEDKLVGFKLAATNKGMGLGNTLQGSDAISYPKLGGNDNMNIVYSIEEEPVQVDIDGKTVDAYVLGEPAEVAKIKRSS